MTTLGRILIILVAFALVMGITYFAVNAVSSAVGAPVFAGENHFPQPEHARPLFPGGAEREGHSGGNILRLIFGLVRNISIVAMIVALVIWFKDFLEKRKRTARQAAK